MFETLSTSLGIANDIQKDLPAVIPDTKEEQDAKDDFTYARDMIREVIEKTSDAFDEMIEIAKASEHPRSFEVVNQIAGNIKDMAESLVKLHKETNTAKAKVQPGSVVNNNVLAISSTEELINMLREQTKGISNGITIDG